MKLSLKGLAAAGAVLWGGAILLVGLGGLLSEGYGTAFLEFAASIYPGYEAGRSVGQVLVGTLYGLLDGAIGGFIIAWVHNRFATGDP